MAYRVLLWLLIIYFMCKGEVKVNVLVYVDNIIIYGNYSSALNYFKKYIGECFHMKDLETL